MQSAALWESQPPLQQALDSSMPFMYDTLRIEQWLQWVFVPRLHALLDAGTTLPGACSVHPLAEHEWGQRRGEAQWQLGNARVLAVLRQIDQSLSERGLTG